MSAADINNRRPPAAWVHGHEPCSFRPCVAGTLNTWNHAMTLHEQTIRAHCEQHGINIEVLPSGAVRFIGRGVSLTAADVASVTTANLSCYMPRKPHALRNV